MISADQPKIFADDLIVAVSSRDDGTMLDRAMGIHDGSIVSNRTLFCQKAGLDYKNVVYQRINYDQSQIYDVIREVDQNSTVDKLSEVAADALITNQSGVGLFLPIADCVATVIYDPKNRYLAMAHLGRHSTVADLAKKLIDKLVAKGSNAKELLVWMSPSAQKQSYKMEWFDRADQPDWQEFCQKKADGYYLDMSGYNQQKFIESGVLKDNIEISAVDTITNQNYFSHAAGDTKGRFAVVSVMQ
ncbi:hypothetical protein CR969_00605 [Candidatus Saccharibacteria bacterium]|nr:MAG: hypothetical protein CR969_00605 [Candidatus Saccharibacteria bacterium]